MFRVVTGALQLHKSFCALEKFFSGLLFINYLAITNFKLVSMFFLTVCFVVLVHTASMFEGRWLERTMFFLVHWLFVSQALHNWSGIFLRNYPIFTDCLYFTDNFAMYSSA